MFTPLPAYGRVRTLGPVSDRSLFPAMMLFSSKVNTATTDRSFPENVAGKLDKES
jgi:hypothetical protein